MSAVRYKGPPDVIRLGARLITVGTTISAPNHLVQELLAHPGFEKIGEAPNTPKSEVVATPSKKQKKKSMDERPQKKLSIEEK